MTNLLLDIRLWAALIVAGALLTLGWQARAWTIDPPEKPPPDTVYAEGPLELPDLPEPTTPDQVTEYDTSDIRTECVQVPTWLASSTTSSDTASARQKSEISLTEDTSATSVTSPPDTGPRLAGPNYAITPLINGSPTLSVGAEQVVLSSYVRGQGRTWTYDVPENNWHIWPSLEAAATPHYLQAGAWTNVRWKKVTLSAGYVQGGDERGVYVRVSLRPFTISF